MPAKPSLLYLINGANAGGAEHGLLFLIQNGFFDGHNATFMCLHKGTLWEKFEKACAEHGHTLLALHDGESLSLKNFLRAFPRVFAWLRHHKPQHLVCSLKQANIIGRTCAMAFPRLRVTSFEHTATYTAKRGGRLMATVWAVWLWATSWRVGTIWVDCKPTWHQMRRWFLPRKRHIQTVPLVMFQPETIPEKTDFTLGGTIRLLAVGRLISPKRFAWAIDAAAAVQQAFPEKKVALTLIGEGPERENLAQRAATQNVSVQLPGYDAAWQKNAHTYDLMLTPSENEGLSMSTLEAMAASLPVVACAVGGIKNYGKHWHNMALVRPKKAKDFTATATTVLQNDRLRHNMGHFARETALKLFSPEALTVAKKHAFGKS